MELITVGAILDEVIGAPDILLSECNIIVDIFSVTSFSMAVKEVGIIECYYRLYLAIEFLIRLILIDPALFLDAIR